MTKPLRSQPTRDRILAAAKRLFAELGSAGTTIRTVAEAAGIHASMVMRYYESKEGLFAAAATFDLRLPDLSRVPRSHIGETLIRHALDRWEGPEAGDELPALIRAAMTHEAARERMLSIFHGQLVPALERVVPAEEVESRAALVATQVLGLALARDVLRLPPAVALSREIIIERIGANIQNCLG